MGGKTGLCLPEGGREGGSLLRYVAMCALCAFLREGGREGGWFITKVCMFICCKTGQCLLVGGRVVHY